VRAGEVVGIAGVSGNGQQELMRALSGEDVRAPRGSIRSSARTSRATAAPAPPRRAPLRARGAARPRRGADALAGTEHAPHAHPRGRPRRVAPRRRGRQARRGADPALLGARRRPRFGGEEPSGGNLQKFIVGREIDADPKLLIVSQPTWGVDVGAAAQIRGELLALRDNGCAVLVVSEELDELFEICDRLVVIARGRVSPSVATARHRSSRSASG
jgi:simple sugar transport system ATP-binding protein